MGFLDKVLTTIFGNKSDKDIKGVMPLVEKVKVVYPTLTNLSDDELRNKTHEFRREIAEYLEDIDAEMQNIRDTTIGADVDPYEKERRYELLDKLQKDRDAKLEEVLLDILPEAFAVVKETARRFTENDHIRVKATDLDRDLSVNRMHMEIDGDYVTYQTTWKAAGADIKWNMVHYDVQLIGGIVLHQGKIAEMATGEGKTLVATLPAYLNGLSGQGVHVVTVNNYLARRDSEWMEPIFNFLGLTVDCIDKHRPNSADRRNAYLQDIVYGTNNEFGFDYLRDNMVRSPKELVQRKHHFAMIDEVDSVLIDDARTPLIISGPVERGDEHQFDALKPRIERLVNAQRQLARSYLVEAKKQITAGRPGENEGGLALLRSYRGLPRNKQLIKFLGESGMKTILLNAENYYMQEQGKRMPEVDQELYFVIEEKNNQVTLTDKGIQLITGADEDASFFVMPDFGGAMADLENDTSLSDEEKLHAKDTLLQDYAIKSERIHSVNQLLKAYTLFEKDVEYVVMDDKVKIVDEQTGRIMDGRRYSDGLHQAIEAKEDVDVEAATQTFATITLQNFFRMYHKLAGMTGTAETEAGEFWEIYNLDVVVIPTNRPIARADDEDLVYRTAREKYNAVIAEVEQMREQGRPVLVGTTSVEVSELLSRLMKMKGIEHNVLNAKQHEREAEIVSMAGKAGAVTIATNMAGRGTDIKLGDGVKEAGGLGIIGTERHEARRVDRQLRGRAGRQGDPGSSQFFVSLEDNLMRLFGSERIAKVMDRMGYEEGEVIQHSMITNSIARAQKKVEENNFGIRKHLLDYDEVMNAQRTVVYKKRKHALFGERLSVDLHNTFAQLCEEVVASSQGDETAEQFKLDVIRYFSVDTEIDEQQLLKGNGDAVIDQLYDEVSDYYKRKSERIMEIARPFITRVFEDKGETVERVIIPFTDGFKLVNVSCNLKDAYESNGKSLVRELEKVISLSMLDDAWKNHLRDMDSLKQEVQAARYEQKDPLLIYKGEAYKLFQGMVSELNKEITSFLFRASIPVQQPEEVKEARQPKKTDMSRLRASRTDDNSGGTQRATSTNTNSEAQKPKTYRREMPKVGRNSPCPCGSGKKFKHCHGKPTTTS